jgi:hypothetical protein
MALVSANLSISAEIEKKSPSVPSARLFREMHLLLFVDGNRKRGLMH